MHWYWSVQFISGSYPICIFLVILKGARHLVKEDYRLYHGSKSRFLLSWEEGPNSVNGKEDQPRVFRPRGTENIKNCCIKFSSYPLWSRSSLSWCLSGGSPQNRAQSKNLMQVLHLGVGPRCAGRKWERGMKVTVQHISHVGNWSFFLWEVASEAA